MARRGGGRAGNPAARDTKTLRQRETKSTARRMVDGGKRLRDRHRSGEHPERVVIVAGSDDFHRDHAPACAPDVAVLELRLGDVPAAFRWPTLPDTVEAFVEDVRETVLRSLVAVLYTAGALVVEVFTPVAGRLEHFASFARGGA